MITWENYEEYMMMHADGELQVAEVQALMDFVSRQPELKNELALYEATRLSPDVALMYENKESLIKPLPIKRVSVFPVWGRYAAAACIVGLLCVSVFKYNRQHNDGPAIVKTKTTIPATETPGPKIEAAQNIVAAQQNTTVVQQAPGASIQHKNEAAHHNMQTVDQRNRNAVVTVEKRIKKTNNIKEVKDGTRPVNDPIAALPTAAVKKIPNTDARPTIAVATDVPVYAQAARDDETDKRSFLDRLPIDDIKKKQLGNIASSISDVYKDISQPNKTGDKRFGIKIEKKKLILSF